MDTAFGVFVKHGARVIVYCDIEDVKGMDKGTQKPLTEEMSVLELGMGVDTGLRGQTRHERSVCRSKVLHIDVN